MYGRFTVNLGVYVPEVARHQGGGEAKSIVQEYHCCVRARIGSLGAERADLWWDLPPDASLVGEIQRRLEGDALPFLDRFKSRRVAWKVIPSRVVHRGVPFDQLLHRLGIATIDCATHGLVVLPPLKRGDAVGVQHDVSESCRNEPSGTVRVHAEEER